MVGLGLMLKWPSESQDSVLSVSRWITVQESPNKSGARIIRYVAGLYRVIRGNTRIFNFNLPDVSPLFLALITGDYARVPRPRISEHKNTGSPKVWWIFFGVQNHLSSWYDKDRNCGKAHQEKIEKIQTGHPEMKYKLFREGATLHLFLIFTRVEIKINGLISDQCRSFFSSSTVHVNGTYQTQFAGLCKEHQEPESINNLQFKLA